jgi:hypothetical protein
MRKYDSYIVGSREELEQMVQFSEEEEVNLN